jgi:glycosyltransferase involved in cell wall biosynthesis
MKNLSVVIITKNESKNIARCLKSVADLSNDIIIIDSFSNDDTKDICNNFNLRFFEQNFTDYSSQKNYGNNLSKNEYILSIDADECLSEELKNSIESINIDKSQNKAFTFNRLNHHSGKPIKHGGWYPDKKLRIFNKNYGEWQGEIHEKIIFSSSSEIQHLKGDLLHYTYNSFEEHLNQAIKFSNLNAQSDFKNKRRVHFIQQYTSPFFRFIQVYFLKSGFLDGKIGFNIAKITAHATFLRRKELISLNKRRKI